MAWTKTKAAVATGIAIAALAVVCLVWKLHHPAVDDMIFRKDYRGLAEAPNNLLILRPTHFAASPRRGGVSNAASQQAGKFVRRMMGRKVSLKQVVAAAYSCTPDRVELPPSAPQGDYDFLVTLPEKQTEHLQAALKEKLGWVATWKPREAEVLALKVKSTESLNQHLSPKDGQMAVSFRNGKLQATHIQLSYLAAMLGNALQRSIPNETGQNGYYDVSLDWNWNQLRTNPDPSIVGDMLNPVGLELHSETAQLSMLVVEKAR